jgi:hypothetical protein
VTNIVDLYKYRSQNLLLAYGLALLVALIANVLGIIAFWCNGVSVGRTWTDVVSATTDIQLFQEPHRKRRASLPFPDDLEKKMVTVAVMPEGGYSFKLVDTEAPWRRKK